MKPILRPKIIIDDFLKTFKSKDKPSRAQVLNWCRSGKLEATKFGKTWYIFTDAELREPPKTDYLGKIINHG